MGPEGATITTGAHRGDGMVTFTSDPTWGPDCQSAEPPPPPPPPPPSGEARLEIVKTVDAKWVHPGEVVGYTVTVRNSGDATATAAQITDRLEDVLDDAVLKVRTLRASSGSVTYRRPVITWRGDIAPGGTVTITYEVRVTGHGNGRLANRVTGPSNSNCRPGSWDRRCRTHVHVKTRSRHCPPSAGSRCLWRTGDPAPFPMVGGSTGVGVSVTKLS
ncbi:DUF11 domain-containing protein [Actinomadura logoneensis]|uniref:DUF11 domain-containing protein n=1 Tax=Actinomadura logoneensis TaxID=2293572 RepID=A0A372JKV5_9ACTN|nr:DUF11 domain-containing protein [Actinomadura logoneensis]